MHECTLFSHSYGLNNTKKRKNRFQLLKAAQVSLKSLIIKAFQTDLRIFSYGEMDNPVEKERALKYHTFQCLVKIMLRENQLLMLESHKSRERTVNTDG